MKCRLNVVFKELYIILLILKQAKSKYIIELYKNVIVLYKKNNVNERQK